MRAQHRRGDELGDALAALHFERLVAEVGEDDLHLAAIVAVDRAGRVETGDAMLQREAGPRADLNLVAVRDLDCEASGDGVALPRLKRQVLGCDDIQPGRMFGRIVRQRQAFAVGRRVSLISIIRVSCPRFRVRASVSS